jgi:hypothetical protein
MISLIGLRGWLEDGRNLIIKTSDPRKGKLVMIHDKKLIQIPPSGLNFADDPGT